MGDKPYLIYLHGVGEGDPGQTWRAGLLDGLEAAGYPDLDGVEVIAPRYAHALWGSDDENEMPPLTISTPRGERRRVRQEFERRTAAMETRLSRHAGGNGAVWADAVVDVAARARVISKFRQANNYVRDDNVRASVQHRLVGLMPSEGRAVLVAHSLGTVVAADLVRRLPPGLEITGCVTLGSPLANANFAADALRDNLAEPPANVAWWVNFWSDGDPVTALRGLSSVFPWLLDCPVHTSWLPSAAHAASEYLSQRLVAEAVGYGLFGSKSTALVRAGSSMIVPPDGPERIALEGLRLAHLIGEHLKGEQQERYHGALRQVQARVVSDLKRRAEVENRSVCTAVAEMDFDSADPQAPLPVPRPAGYIGKDEAVVRLIALAQQDLLLPFEISIKPAIRKQAMQDLTAEMGLGSHFGTQVFDALDEAGRALPGASRPNWLKWGALGAGFAAMLAGAVGLVLAPGAGLAGAAAIVNALASFGPGGMIGGLVTAGSLVSAGAGGIAVGIMSPANSPESVEALVRSQLAALILRRQHSLELDDHIWQTWKDSEISLTREIRRLAEFSDEKSTRLQDLERKLATVQGAMGYATDHDLAPRIVLEADHGLRGVAGTA